VLNMSIKVIKNRVFDGKKTYEVGATISKLSAEDEENLVESGVCEYIGKQKQVAPTEDPPEDDNIDDKSNEDVDDSNKK
jgi:hypothetical protein